MEFTYTEDETGEGAWGSPDGANRIAVKNIGNTAVTVTAASVFRAMQVLDAQYPVYGFGKHMGYGTAAHLEALQKLGPCPIHRMTFRPVREIISPPPEQPELF